MGHLPRLQPSMEFPRSSCRRASRRYGTSHGSELELSETHFANSRKISSGTSAPSNVTWIPRSISSTAGKTKRRREAAMWELCFLHHARIFIVTASSGFWDRRRYPNMFNYPLRRSCPPPPHTPQEQNPAPEKPPNYHPPQTPIQQQLTTSSPQLSPNGS